MARMGKTELKQNELLCLFFIAVSLTSTQLQVARHKKRVFYRSR